jgi:hypothetical protein
VKLLGRGRGRLEANRPVKLFIIVLIVLNSPICVHRCAPIFLGCDRCRFEHCSGRIITSNRKQWRWAIDTGVGLAKSHIGASYREGDLHTTSCAHGNSSSSYCAAHRSSGVLRLYFDPWGGRVFICVHLICVPQEDMMRVHLRRCSRFRWSPIGSCVLAWHD